MSKNTYRNQHRILPDADRIAQLEQAARDLMDSIQGGYPGLETVASWKFAHVRVLVGSEPLAALAALLLKAEGGAK